MYLYMSHRRTPLELHKRIRLKLPTAKKSPAGAQLTLVIGWSCFTLTEIC